MSLVGRRILLVTYGSHGDLHPYLAMGRVLRAAGASVTLATHPQYEAPARALGLDFVSIPPGHEQLPLDESWARRSNHALTGLKVMMHEMVLPYFAEAESILMKIAGSFDSVITHFLTIFAPAVAEAHGVPWLSVALSPTSMFSVYDPPAVGVLPFLPALGRLGPRAMTAFYEFLEYPSRGWFETLHEQRRKFGLKALTTNPIFRYRSPHGTLALFPEWFAAPQPDWPSNTMQIGFPLFQRGDDELDSDLTRFLASGPPPVVFTLGTWISAMSTDFFRIARDVCEESGQRAIMVVGENATRELPPDSPDARIVHVKYAPFERLLPRARAIVHPGGISTMALALKMRCPQICVSFANDQLDNARRVRALGAGHWISARGLSRRRLRRALANLPVVRAFGEDDGFDARLVVAIDSVLDGKAGQSTLPSI